MIALAVAVVLLPGRAEGQQLLWFNPGTVLASQVLASPATGEIYAINPDSSAVSRWSASGAQFEGTLSLPYHYSRWSGDFSPDGSQLALAGWEDQRPPWTDVYYYAAPEWNQLTNPFDALSTTTTVRYSHDGSFVLFGGYSNDSIVLERRVPLSNVIDHSMRFGSYFSGTILIDIAPRDDAFALGDDSRFYLWRLADPAYYFRTTNLTSAVAISADGRYVASGNYDASISVRDFATGIQIALLGGLPYSSVSDLKFDPQTGYLIAAYSSTSTRKCMVIGWNISTRSVAFAQRVFGSAVSIAIPTSGPSFYVLGWPGIMSFNRATGSPGTTFGDSHGGVLAFGPDGSYVMSGGSELSRLAALTGAVAWRRQHFEDFGSDTALSPNGGQFAVADGNQLDVFDPGTGILLKSIPYSYPISNVAYSPDSAWVAFARSDFSSVQGEILVYRTDTWSQVGQISVPSQTGGSMEFSSDGKLLLVGLDNGMLNVYSTVTWTLVDSAYLNQNANRLTFTVSPNGKFIASAYSHYPPMEEGVKVLRAADLSELYSLPRSPSGLRFSPDSSTLWLSNNGIYAYRVADGVQVFESNQPEIRSAGSIAVSPNNALVAFSRKDGSIGMFKNPIR